MATANTEELLNEFRGGVSDAEKTTSTKETSAEIDANSLLEEFRGSSQVSGFNQGGNIGSFGQRLVSLSDGVELEEAESQSLLEKLASSPFATGIGTLGEVARREEGVFANSLLEMTSREPSLKGLLKGATEAITGKKTAEFGDFLKSQGAGDFEASVGGLVMSAFLPSNFLLAGAGKTAKISRANAKALKNVFTRTPNGTRNPIIAGVSNFLAKDPRRVKQLIDNADVYSPRNADPRNAKIIASKIQRGLRKLREKAPDALEPSPNVPINIARKGIGAFDEIFKAERIRHNQLIKQVVKNNPDFNVTAKKLVSDMIDTVKSSEKDLIRKTNVPGAEIASSRKFFSGLVKKINSKKSGKFGLQDLVDLREDLGKLAEGSFQVQGQPPVVNSTIDSLVKTLRNRISRTIKDNFQEISQSDDIFVKLGEVDNALKLRGIRKEGQLGNLLKSKNINPFKAEGIGILDEILPDNVKVAPALENFVTARNSSLSSRLSKIGIKSGDKLGSEKAALNFDAIETPGSQVEILRKLNNELRKVDPNLEFFEDLAKFDLARSFSRAGSIFKASATGNLAAGAIPEAKAVGLLAGVGATIPPIFARSVQGAQAVGRGASRAAGSAPGRLGQAAILRKLLASQTSS